MADRGARGSHPAGIEGALGRSRVVATGCLGLGDNWDEMRHIYR